MSILEIIIISLSLSLDAFTISVCKSIKNSSIKNGLITTFSFSIFQFIMPILGFYLGSLLSNKIINYHSYFSSILLIIIGILMLKDEKIEVNDKLNYQELFFLSIATSIDAFVVGISFSFIKTNILLSATIIGLITFIFCFIGYYLGNILNKKYHQYANIIGGITLIIIGIKILFN